MEVQQPDRQVTVEQPAPQVVITRPDPEVTVTQQEPEVTVRQAEPQVEVRQAEPQVQVSQAEPEVVLRDGGEPVVTERDTQTDRPAAAADTQIARQSAEESESSSLSAADLVGQTVRTVDGEEVGEVSEVGVSPGDTRTHALVDVGGFLGIGERTVALPLDTLGVDSEGNVQTRMTREELENLPEADADQYAELEEDGAAPRSRL